MDGDDDEDYYAQPENQKLEAKSQSKIPTTTDLPSERDTTMRAKYEDTTIKIFTQKSPTQKQVTAIINPDKNVRLTQTQNGRTIQYPRNYESKVEQRNRNEDKLNKNNVDEDSDSDDGSSDILISKTTQKIKYKTRYLPSKPSDTKNSIESENSKDSYVSVTNSLSGNISDNSKFDSTYITKSSSCGTSTFSCNIVYSSEGKRTQVWTRAYDIFNLTNFLLSK